MHHPLLFNLFLGTGWSCVSSCSDGSQPLRDVLLLLGQSEPVRLVGGANSREGRVEISHGDQWGTVCNNNWDLVDANVSDVLLSFSCQPGM